MNLKRLMNNKGYKRIKDDSLDDFDSGSNLKGLGEKGRFLFISGVTNVDEKTFEDIFKQSVVYLKKGVGLNTDGYFIVRTPNKMENIYNLIKDLKSVNTWAIKYEIDKNPSVFSPTISNTKWFQSNIDDIIEIMLGKV